MKTENLISLYQGALALEENNISSNQIKLKKQEVSTLAALCNDLIDCHCTIKDFDGFIANYTIKQINKEFDLLRFSDSLIINIELKSAVNLNNIENKISEQLQKNHYYLKSLGIPLRLFAYTEDGRFFEYDLKTASLIQINSMVVASCLQEQIVNYTIDPDKLFIPSNYLISPFNTTDKFINNEYFLTEHQRTIKNDILAKLNTDSFFYYFIHANAGTGKTLLIYDIAKEIQSQSKTSTIIHCGYINFGQSELTLLHNWSIRSIKTVKEYTISAILDRCDVLIIDESQRITKNQLDLIIDKTTEYQIPIIFSYDVKQKLGKNEGKDIQKYISSNYPKIPCYEGKLTNKIRTNKEIASFITNLFFIGRSTPYLNYKNITINYFSSMKMLKDYADYLSQDGWEILTYTSSLYTNTDPFIKLSHLSPSNSHSVIGQEFSKVVCVMDSTFYYKENKLSAKKSYYNALGMLYENVTRVINELMIIVYDNPALYETILKLKNHE